MDTVRCPMCGKENAASSERCSFCNAALRPFNISSTPAKPANENDWLSSLREDSEENQESTSSQGETFSDGNEPIEEAPDWLQRIRQRMVEDQGTGSEESAVPAPQEPEGSDAIPSWLKGLSDLPAEDETSQQPDFVPEPEPQSENPESTEDWLSRLQEPAQEEKPPVQKITERSEEGPVQEAPVPDELEAEEWLKNLAAWQAPVSYEESKDVKPYSPEQTEEPFEEENLPVEIFRTPDHIQGFFQDEQKSFEQPEEQPTGRSEEQPDWFKAIQQHGDLEGHTEPPGEEHTEPPVEEPILPSWLQDFDRTIEASATSKEASDELPFEQDQSSKAEPAFLEEEPVFSTGEGERIEGISAFFSGEAEKPEGMEEKETPELSSLEEFSKAFEPSGTTPEQEPEEKESGLPDWLADIPAEKEEQPSAVVPPFEENILPDWLNKVQEPPESANAPFPPVFDVYQPVDRNPEEPVSPFEVPDLPEWFSEIPQQAEPSPAGEIPVPAEEIAPAELPTWLKAMKPEEPRVPASSDAGFLQQSGPLAGLPEILPSVEQSLIIRNTAAQAGKLLVSEKQQQSADVIATLLNKLGEATAEAPIKKKTKSNWSRPVIAALLIVVILAAIILPLPASSGLLLMSESAEAAYTLVDSLAPDQPVLLAFDFEPAYSGELSYAGRGMIQHLVKKNVRLAFVSTSATGTVMADTILQQSLKEMPEMADQEMISTYMASRTANLGYLAGGTASLQEFAQNPQHAARDGLKAAMDGVPTWTLPALVNIQSINDFAMVIVFTDSSETGRAWVEQVKPQLDNIPLIMATTSLAAPMMEPYYESLQVNGLVTGLTDGSRYHTRMSTNAPAVNIELALQASAGLAAMILFVGLVFFSIQNMRANRRKD